MKILVTGAAGFIGFHLSRRLLDRGETVVGIDNMNDYYDVNLKYSRLEEIGIRRSTVEEAGASAVSDQYDGFSFYRLDCGNTAAVSELFGRERFDAVCHLAAQAGVRYSLVNPGAYIGSNISGFFSILEACRQHKVMNLVYASSSSVYGLNKRQPFSTEDNVDHPISLYAATKKSNELLAHTYSYLFGIKTTGLRFFTVYGPWGRPDMALFKFTRAILEGETIEVNNYGNMRRDFTYIDDIVEGVCRVIDCPPECVESYGDGETPAPYKIFNIGRGAPAGLLEFISEIEKQLGISAEKKMMPLPAGDVPETFADISGLQKDIGYAPETDLQYGIGKFIDWYKSYYKVEN